MVHHISEEALGRLSKFVNDRMALHFPKERWRDLERGLKSAAAQLGFENARQFVDRLLSAPLSKAEIEILASHLTVGETYFFRDHKLFKTLEEQILPELIQARRGGEQRLRIWSAGCCTGEEPYSIAMLLSRLLPNRDDWNITILATDINPQFLQAASAGIYKEWSFRDTAPEVKQKYFEQIDKHQYRIAHWLKEMVAFAYLNLAEDVYPSLLNNTNAMDIILCRNVLMYFSPEQVNSVTQKLSAALVEGGWFLVSPSETSLIAQPQLRRINLARSILYKKSPVAEAVETHRGPLPEDAPPVETKPRAQARPVEPPQKIVKKIAPEPEPDLYEEALIFYQGGRYAEAAERLATLVSSEPSNANAAALMARVFANQGRLADALRWCNTALAVKKLDPELHYLQATILQEQGAIDSSVASLRRALYLDPKFILAHFALGNLAVHQEKTGDAERHFENALSLLNACSADDVLPASDGITAARLGDIIHATIQQERAA